MKVVYIVLNNKRVDFTVFERFNNAIEACEKWEERKLPAVTFCGVTRFKNSKRFRIIESSVY